MPTVKIGDNTGDDYSGTIDTRIVSSAATTNYGSGSSFQVNKWGSGNWTHGLVSFTGLSNISPTVTVSAATVYLYLSSTAGTNTQTMSFKRLLQNWVELQSTWNIYSTGNNWGTAGATNVTDRSSTDSGGMSVDGTTGVYKSMSSAQLAQDVADFINGVYSNYGWHIERTDGSNDSTTRTFISKDGNNAQRPYLSVTYEAAGGGLSIPIAMYHYQHHIGSGV